MRLNVFEVCTNSSTDSIKSNFTKKMSTDLPYTKVLPSGGFDFSNCLRNHALEQNGGIKVPNKNIKTGTTIVGAKFKVSPNFMF